MTAVGFRGGDGSTSPSSSAMDSTSYDSSALLKPRVPVPKAVTRKKAVKLTVKFACGKSTLAVLAGKTWSFEELAEFVKERATQGGLADALQRGRAEFRSLEGALYLPSDIVGEFVSDGETLEMVFNQTYRHKVTKVHHGSQLILGGSMDSPAASRGELVREFSMKMLKSGNCENMGEADRTGNFSNTQKPALMSLEEKVEAQNEEDLHILELRGIVMAMQGSSGVRVCRRVWGPWVFANVFTGTDAVTWLSQTFSITRREAVVLGNKIFSAGYLSHVFGVAFLLDRNYFYRFSDAIEMQEQPLPSELERMYRQMLKSALGPRRETANVVNLRNLRQYVVPNCVSGAEIVNWIIHTQSQSKQQATVIGQQLVDSGYIHLVPYTAVRNSIFGRFFALGTSYQAEEFYPSASALYQYRDYKEYLYHINRENLLALFEICRAKIPARDIVGRGGVIFTDSFRMKDVLVFLRKEQKLSKQHADCIWELMVDQCLILPSQIGDMVPPKWGHDIGSEEDYYRFTPPHLHVTGRNLSRRDMARAAAERLHNPQRRKRLTMKYTKESTTGRWEFLVGLILIILVLWKVMYGSYATPAMVNALHLYAEGNLLVNEITNSTTTTFSTSAVTGAAAHFAAMSMLGSGTDPPDILKRSAGVTARQAPRTPPMVLMAATREKKESPDKFKTMRRRGGDSDPGPSNVNNLLNAGEWSNVVDWIFFKLNIDLFWSKTSGANGYYNELFGNILFTRYEGSITPCAKSYLYDEATCSVILHGESGMSYSRSSATESTREFTHSYEENQAMQSEFETWLDNDLTRSLEVRMHFVNQKLNILHSFIIDIDAEASGELVIGATSRIVPLEMTGVNLLDIVILVLTVVHAMGLYIIFLNSIRIQHLRGLYADLWVYVAMCYHACVGISYIFSWITIDRMNNGGFDWEAILASPSTKTLNQDWLEETESLYEHSHRAMVMGTMFLLVLQLKYSSEMRATKILTKTIHQGYNELKYFFFLTFTSFVGFTFVMHVLLGRVRFDFSSISRSSLKLFESLAGIDLEFMDGLSTFHFIMAYMWLILFVFLIIFVLLNMAVTLIALMYDNVRADLQQREKLTSSARYGLGHSTRAEHVLRDVRSRSVYIPDCIINAKATYPGLEALKQLINIGTVSLDDMLATWPDDSPILAMDVFVNLLKKVFSIETSVATAIAAAIDVDRSGAIEKREFLSSIAILCKGTKHEKMQFAFKVIDLDNDGFLSSEELNLFWRGFAVTSVDVLISLVECSMYNESIKKQLTEFEVEDLGLFKDVVEGVREILESVHPSLFVETVIRDMDGNHDMVVSIDEFVSWAEDNDLMGSWLAIIARHFDPSGSRRYKPNGDIRLSKDLLTARPVQTRSVLSFRNSRVVKGARETFRDIKQALNKSPFEEPRGRNSELVSHVAVKPKKMKDLDMQV